LDLVRKRFFLDDLKLPRSLKNFKKSSLENGKFISRPKKAPPCDYHQHGKYEQ